MVKITKKPKNNAKRKTSNKKAVRPAKITGKGLDMLASKYAELLADPCSGPLVSGPFGDGTGGLIARYEQDIVLDSQATAIGSAIVFCPSALTYSFSNVVPLSADTTLFFPYVVGNTANHSGLTSLAAQGGTFRVLSACLQVYYPGSEVSRAGIMGIGQAPFGSFAGPTGVSTSSMRTLANYVERTPEAYSEIVWRPSEFDLQWTQSNNIDAPGSSNELRRSTLFSSTTGLPVSTGMRYRMVAVVEFVPSAGFGQTSIVHQPASNNTLTHVLNTLESYGDWAYQGAMAIGHTASKLYAGAQAVGRVSYGVAKLAALTMG
jgi:hypothetical protein